MVPSTTAPFELEYLKDDWTPPDPAKVEAAREAAEARAGEELGQDYAFVEMWALATPDQMLADLKVEERLDARIDKLVHRLMNSKTFKSLSFPTSSRSTELPGISGPKKAA